MENKCFILSLVLSIFHTDCNCFKGLRKVIKTYLKTIGEPELKIIEDFQPSAWIYVENPSEKELLDLSDYFSLEIGLLEDAVDFYEVPRIEIEEGVTYIYTQFPYKLGIEVVTIPVLFVVGKDFFVTISEREFPFIERFTKERIDFYTTQKTKLFLQLFSQINATYNIFLRQIIRQVKSSRIQLEKIANKDVVQLVAHEEVLNNFMSVLVPTNNVLKRILSGRYVQLYDEDKDLLEDLFLDIGQLMEMCRSNLKNIANIRDAYSTIMTNNLNSVVKLLTSLTVVLMVPTLISSLYGMNVKLPFAGSPIAFVGILIFTFLLSLLILAIFIRKRFF